VRGTFIVKHGDEVIATMRPESRSYPTPPMQISASTVHTTVGGDLYAVIGEADGKGGWAVRLYKKPVIIWLWLGAVIMALGGGVSLSDRRFRIGVPKNIRPTIKSGRVKPDAAEAPVKA
jgi:cytochrome c-type biogenesis protein CcmF